MTEPGPRTAEEQQLSDLLQRTVPEPHRSIDLDQITPYARRHRSQGWLPALAAACILILAAVLGIVAVRARHTEHQAVGPTPGASVGSGSEPTSSSAPLPWSARALVATDQPAQLVALGDRLYRQNSTGFARLNPNTGAVVASTTVSTAWPPVLAAGKLWVVVASPNAYQIEQFDPVNLHDLGGMSGSASGLARAQDPVLAASPDGSQIAFSAGNVVYQQDATRPLAGRQQTVAGPITAIAFSADGTRLFLAHGGARSALATLDLAHSLTLLTDQANPDAGIFDDLIAVPTGLWLNGGGATGSWTDFAPNADLTRKFRVTSTGAGYPLVLTVAGPRAWLAGLDGIACAEANTGAIRLTAKPASAAVYSIAQVGGALIVSYADRTSSGLATVIPPASCGH